MELLGTVHWNATRVRFSAKCFRNRAIRVTRPAEPPKIALDVPRLVLDRLIFYDATGASLRTASIEGLDGDPAGVAIAGSWAAVLGFNGGVALVDVGTGTQLARADGATGRGIVLDGRARIFAGGAEDVLRYRIARE